MAADDETVGKAGNASNQYAAGQSAQKLKWVTSVIASGRIDTALQHAAGQN